MNKKALLVTRVSGFIQQFELDRVHLLQDMGYEVHYAANFDNSVYADSSITDDTGIVCHHIPSSALRCHWKPGAVISVLPNL